MQRSTINNARNPQSLEYIALLSGLSMAGSDISDIEIEYARNTHQAHIGAKRVSFVSTSGLLKHSG